MSNLTNSTALIYSMAALKKGGGSSCNCTLYELALKIGYQGTEEEFNEDFLNLFEYPIYEIINGGISDASLSNDLTAGIVDSTIDSSIPGYIGDRVNFDYSTNESST